MEIDAPLSDLLNSAYAGRRVFVTGHTGFVGAWLSAMLASVGAEVFGYSLPPEPNFLYGAVGLEAHLASSVFADIRDREGLAAAVERARPDVIFHLAAQSLVLRSIADPVATFDTNVVGTANVLDAARHSDVRVAVVITSDKCYAEAEGLHVEGDPLGGNDPYSASKGAAELVVGAFRHTYAAESGLALSSVRAGNIIGGGDWSTARIVPDFLRAAQSSQPLVLRFPQAVRPWQHVLDAVAGYARLGAFQQQHPGEFDEAWNFGPDGATSHTVGDLVDLLRAAWANCTGTESPSPELAAIDNEARERGYLMLDSSKARARLGWWQVLQLPAAAKWTVDWHVAAGSGHGMAALQRQLQEYLELEGERVKPLS